MKLDLNIPRIKKLDRIDFYHLFFSFYVILFTIFYIKNWNIVFMEHWESFIALLLLSTAIFSYCLALESRIDRAECLIKRIQESKQSDKGGDPDV